MTVFISGSVAYDCVCRFEGLFSDLLIPGELAHLNLTFLARDMQKYCGGCAGNIAWAMAAAGSSPRLVATLGKDGGLYLEHLKSAGIGTDHVREDQNSWSAQAFITTDNAGNQLTTFHPGAMFTYSALTPQDTAGISLAIIAPGGLDAMAEHGRTFASAGIPYIFDPGQATSQLSTEALRELVDDAFLVCVSEYEEELLLRRLCIERDELVCDQRSLLVTYGPDGASFFTSQQGRIRIPAVPVPRVIDPVGAGDAFRGGMLCGIEKKLPLLQCGRLGAVMSSFKLEHLGGQNYRPNAEEIRARYEETWHEPFPL